MTVFGIVGGPQANASASGNKFYARNDISTTPSVIVAANPQRRKITFHNPSDVDIFIAPALAYATATATAPTTLTPSTSAKGGCWQVFGAGGTLTLEGEVQGAFQAFAASSSGKALTILDSNI